MAKLTDIMTGVVYTAAPGAALTEVAAAMVKGRFGSAIVLDGGWIAGIFTERDVLRAAAAGADPKSATVGEWMTPDPMTVGPDLDAEEAVEIMASHGFRHLPVVDGRTLLGIVSLRDVLRTRIARSPR